MALETTRTSGWLFSLLTGDAGAGGLSVLVNGRIYPRQAPQGAAKPYVIYTYLRSRVVQGTGTVRTIVRSLYQIEVISQPTTSAQWDVVRAAADRIDEKAGHVLNATWNGYAFNSWLFDPIDRNELNPQTQESINHMGGMFWIEASPL